MGVDERAERASVIERLSDAVRASAQENDDGAREVDHALALLAESDIRMLQEIEREIARDDDLFSHPPLGSGIHGLAAFLGRRYAASIPTSKYALTTPLPRVKADLLDTLVFREIRQAHDALFDRAVQDLKKALGLPEHDSLAKTAFAEYGPLKTFLLLDVASSFATVQLRRTAAHITAAMGYSGIDAYADARDNCHFMTTQFARYLLKSQPSPEKLCAMAARGRLEPLGISPTDVNYERLLTELRKLRALLPELSSIYSSWVPEAGGNRGLPPVEAGRDDEARMAFRVLRRSGVPRTAGEAQEQHLVRRNWALRLRESRAAFAAVCASLAMVGYWMFLQATVQDLSARLLLLVAVLGALLVAAICSLLDAREKAFFRTAAALNQYTVLQGRRDAEFLSALRKIRPDAFTESQRAGLPRMFTVMAERDGVTFLGRGPKPKVVAAFHWAHVAELMAPTYGPAGSPPRVVFVVRRGEEKVDLGFPLERAKVAWTQRNFLENKTMEAVLALLQGLRRGWALPPLGDRRNSDEWDTSDRLALLRSGDTRGTRYEREVADWEFRRPSHLELNVADESHRMQMKLGAAIGALLVGIFVLVPLFSSLS